MATWCTPESTGGKKYYVPPGGVAKLDKAPGSDLPWDQAVMAMQRGLDESDEQW